MKKILLSLLIFTLSAISFSAEKNPLIIYFSHSGNTQTIAELIQKNSNGDIFRIETVKPYPQRYRETTEIVQNEFNTNTYPDLKVTTLDTLKDYDTIFIGYPIWWGTMPMAVQNFIKSNDFSGKTIIPFCTHGGSRFGRSVSDLRNLAPNAEIKSGFETSNADSRNTENQVKQWLNEVLK